MNQILPTPPTTDPRKGYWLVLANVTQPALFGQYTALAGPTLASFGARVLARGDVAQVVEGAIIEGL